MKHFGFKAGDIRQFAFSVMLCKMRVTPAQYGRVHMHAYYITYYANNINANNMPAVIIMPTISTISMPITYQQYHNNINMFSPFFLVEYYWQTFTYHMVSFSNIQIGGRETGSKGTRLTLSIFKKIIYLLLKKVVNF